MNVKKVVFLLRGLEGLGHIVPSSSLAKRLIKHGVDVHFITYSNGVRFLERQGFAHITDIGAPLHQRGAVPWKNMFEITKQVLPLIKKIEPDLVVVDGECDSLFLLGAVDVKVAFVTTPHYVNLNFGYWKEFELYGRAGLQRPNKTIIHGFFKPSGHAPRSVFVGPIVREHPLPSMGKTVPIVLSQGCSSSMIVFAKQAARILKTMGYPARIIGNRGNIRGDTMELFAEAPLIVAHGGMSVIGEIAVLGKPALIMYDDSNEEKIKNAIIFERLEKGKRIDVSLHMPDKFVEATIKSALSLSGKIVPMRNGAERATQILLGMIGEQ